MTSFAGRIGEQDINEFERAGAVCLRAQFDQEWIERLRVAIERRIANGPETHSRKSAAYSFTELFMWKRDPDFRAFIYDSPAASIAAQLMRSENVRFYFDQIFNKEPGMTEPSPWHNDQPFYPIKGKQVCSIWLALDPVTKESSGLEYVAGSQNWEQLPEGKVPDIEAMRDRCEMLSWDMQPGDCLVHSGFTIHGAAGNSTPNTRRRALATRWVGDDVVYRVRDKAHAELQARGLRDGDVLPAGQFPQVDAIVI